MIDPLIILLALACGVAVRKIGYPPMLGYLVAGFVLHSLPIESGELLSAVADAPSRAHTCIPESSTASAAMIPGPPALVMTHILLPDVFACMAKTFAV